MKEKHNMDTLTFFKFCPGCKEEIHTTSNRLINCINCGFHFYFAPALANGVFIKNKKGEILLVKRKNNPNKSFWDTPGGFIEFQETFEQSVRREIKEELGITLRSFQYFGSYCDRYLYKNINYFSLIVIYTSEITTKKLIARDDITEVCFFSKEKLPWKKLAFSWLKKALKDYLSSFYQPKRPKESKKKR